MSGLFFLWLMAETGNSFAFSTPFVSNANPIETRYPNGDRDDETGLFPESSNLSVDAVVNGGVDGNNNLGES